MKYTNSRTIEFLGRKVSFLHPGIVVIALFTLLPVSVQAQNIEVKEERSTTYPIPIMAYYYIWFEPQSWQRAKIDYPLLGNYSSSDREIQRQHIVWAKEAGISGFIVSWKSTFLLDNNIQALIEVAEEEGDFFLSIIYQGLNFNREPLAVEQIEADLNYFLENFAGSPVFGLYNKPVVIWSGTWEFSYQEIERITEHFRDRLIILATEKNVDGYQRIAGLVDGNAYYWSSLNPDTHPSYREKLKQMGESVHSNGGFWIAPAAPGFNAQAVGGVKIVERKDGETLIKEYEAALKSNPDMIGIISWNEFSENTHIEPSKMYSHKYLEVLAEINNLKIESIGPFDSSDPSFLEDIPFPETRFIALGGMVVLVFSSLVVIIRQSNRAEKHGGRTARN